MSKILTRKVFIASERKKIRFKVVPGLLHAGGN